MLRSKNSRRRLLGSGAAMLLLAPFAAGTTKAAELDGELIALCRQYEANEAEWVRLNRIADIRPGETDDALCATAAEAAAARDELLCGELLDQIAELPARTPEGLQAKARAVFAFFSPEPPEYESEGGRALWSLVCELAGKDKTDRRWRPAPLLQASQAPESWTPWQNPDAELIDLCAKHIENVRTYGEYGGRLPWDVYDPLWEAYDSTRKAIHDAEPQTIFGILAIARTAKAEAENPDGEEDTDGQPAEFAWQIVNHLVRIAG